MTTHRFKPVPPAPDDLAAVETARDAVPLVPGTETDCCARIQSALGLAARDDARAWLTFLRALGVVRETDAGFVRARDGAASGGEGSGGGESTVAGEDGGAESDAAGNGDEATADGSDAADEHPDREALAAAFRERVFGVREVLAALDAADGPLTVDETFEAVREMVPEWERRRDPAGWADRWRERVARLLDWAVLLGLAERGEGGYRAAGE